MIILHPPRRFQTALSTIRLDLTVKGTLCTRKWNSVRSRYSVYMLILNNRSLDVDRIKARVWDGKNCNAVYVMPKREKKFIFIGNQFLYFTSCSTPRKLYCVMSFFPSLSRFVWCALEHKNLFLKCQPEHIKKVFLFKLSPFMNEHSPMSHIMWWWNNILLSCKSHRKKCGENFSKLVKGWRKLFEWAPPMIDLLN